jgi:hypothetical protein
LESNPVYYRNLFRERNNREQTGNGTKGNGSGLLDDLTREKMQIRVYEGYNTHAYALYEQTSVTLSAAVFVTVVDLNTDC